MAIVNQTDAAVVRAPGGDAPQLSASTARTDSFANRRVSTREAAALEAVSQRSGRGRRGSGAVTSARRSLLSRFATVVKSAFGASRRTPDELPRGTAHDEGDLAMGPVQRLKEFAADRIERGDLPPGLAGDLQTAVAYAERLDKDNLRVNFLMFKSQDKTLTGAERRELSSLIGANKHNLALLQTWLGDRAAQLREDGGLAPETRMLIDALSVRFGDRHMDLAELMSLYELDEILDEPVSRADRAGANLLHAEAALGMARELSPPGLDPSAKSRLVEDLEAHRDLLAGIQAVSSGRIEAPSDRLALASTELWHAPLPLVKPDEGGSGDIRALRSRWSLKAQGRSDGPWLPVAHQRVGQERMLQEFIRFRLADAGVAKNRMPDLEASLAESYTRVVNDQPWEPISARVRTTLPDERGKNVVVESRIAPGKALAAHFPEDYPSNGINCADRTQYKHVPNLALTTLTNEKGRTLFSGLRHGVIDSYGIDGRRLARLPDDELRKMVGDLLVREDSIEPGGEGRDRAIDNLVAGIRSDRARAAEAAEDMRAQASRDMAREMAVAALVSNSSSTVSTDMRRLRSN